MITSGQKMMEEEEWKSYQMMNQKMNHPPPQDIEEPNDDNSVELGDIDDQGNEVVVVTNDEGEQV